MVHQKRYYVVSLFQLLVLSVVVGLVSVFCTWAIGQPILLGGLVAVLAHAWFTWRTFEDGSVKSSKILVTRANRGAIEKYCLSALGFACIFVIFRPENTVYVFLSYIVMLCLQIFSVFWLNSSTPNR